MSRTNFALSTPFVFPIYSRVRPMTSRPNSYLQSTCIAGVSSATPFNQIRYRTSPFVFGWNSAFSSYKPVESRNSSTLRTMADPVLRTASPYTDPSVKGPKSQQLSTGHSHSLLQHSKSKLGSSAKKRQSYGFEPSKTNGSLVIPNNKVNKTALHPGGVE